jgi:hypothetical protein
MRIPHRIEGTQEFAISADEFYAAYNYLTEKGVDEDIAESLSEKYLLIELQALGM